MFPPSPEGFKEDHYSEIKLYWLLKYILPDDYYVFWNINTGNRKADFIIVGPQLGILILEVKAWALGTINESNSKIFSFKPDEKKEKNPLEQAEEYQKKIEKILQIEPELLQKEDPYKGRLKFSRACGVVFTDIEKEEFTSSAHRNSIDIELILFKDEIKEIDSKKNPGSLIQKFEGMFLPEKSFNFEPLSPDDMNLITKILYKDSSFYEEKDNPTNNNNNDSEYSHSRKKEFLKKIILPISIYLLIVLFSTFFRTDFNLREYITNFTNQNFKSSGKTFEEQPDIILPNMTLKVGNIPQGKGTFILIKDGKSYLISKTLTEGSYIEFYDNKKVIIYDPKSDKTEFDINNDVINLEVGNAYTKIYLRDKEHKYLKCFKYDFVNGEIVK